LEKQISNGGKGFGYADVVFEDHNLAIELKGLKSDYKKGVGQAINYECGGYSSALVVPKDGVRYELLDVVTRASIGLISISSSRRDSDIHLTVHYEPSGGWPFESDENKTPPQKRGTPKSARDPEEIIIDESTDWQKYV
jgi:hypothetical protein